METTDDLAEATRTSCIRQREGSLLAAIAPTLASVVLAAVVAAIVVVVAAIVVAAIVVVVVVVARNVYASCLKAWLHL